MSVELVCPHCEGRLLAEAPQTVVACPHCGEHLMTPDASTFAAAEATAAESGLPPTESEATEALVVESGIVPPVAEETGSAAAGPYENDESESPQDDGGQDRVFDAPSSHVVSGDSGLEAFRRSLSMLPATGPSSLDAESLSGKADRHPSFCGPTQPESQQTGASPHFRTDSDSEAADEAGRRTDRAEESFPDFSLREQEHVVSDGDEDEQTTELPSEGFAGGGSFGGTALAVAQPSSVVTRAQAAARGDERPARPAVVVQRQPAARPRVPTVPLLWFVAAVSYASAVTIAFGYYLVASRNPDPHQLESLPDIVPPMKNGEILPVLVPFDAPMPKGHTLRLGESRRFGSLQVTPLRVERAPLAFTHFHDPDETKAPTAPVLKLWLRLENVSQDQAFVPLCRELVFKRHVSRQAPDRDAANNFVCRRSDKQSGGSVVFAWPLVIDDVWDPAEQDLGRVLAPGEVFETYIPSDEQGLARLSGPLLWRVHFRKGCNPQSRRGVTTLIEVDFHSDEIVARNG